MIGNGKTMGFFLNITDQREDCLIGIDADLLPFRRHQRSGTVAIILDHTEYVHPQSQLCKGIKGMVININENVVTEQYLCGEGHAHNEVTGMAPQVQITGDRVEGDAAQDYIAGLQFELGSDRNSSVKITAEGKVITCDCTIGAITTFGGNTTDVNAFGCTIRFNGKPTVTTAQ